MPTPTPKYKLVIDCDPGVDDTLAILLALTSAEADVLAFIPQFGNTDANDAYNNILKIYGVLDKHIKANPTEAERFPAFGPSKKPVIVKGASGPISGAVHTAKYFHGGDGLGDITKRYPQIPLPEPSELVDLLDIRSSQQPGHKSILDLIKSEPDESIIYIALGPCTNLALLLKEDEKLFKQKAKLVSIMGGALDVPGNTSPNAEFNFYADASAAQEVVSHAETLPIYLAPLDITTNHTMPWSAYAEHVDQSFPEGEAPSSLAPLPYFTSAFLRHTQAVMARYGKKAMELHDPLSVWFALEAAKGNLVQGGWQTQRREFAVERQGELTLGMCVVDRRGGAPASERGKSRAELQEQMDKQASAQPANVQVDSPEQAELEQSQGVNVIVKTPGVDELARVLFKQIWGVSSV